MVGAQGVRPGVASQSRPQRGRNAADLACAGLLTFEPQVGFPIQLKLQMVRKCRNTRVVPRTAPSAITDAVREPARLDCNGEPLPGLVAEFAFLRSEHLACLPLLSAAHGRSRTAGGGSGAHRSRRDPLPCSLGGAALTSGARPGLGATS